MLEKKILVKVNRYINTGIYKIKKSCFDNVNRKPYSMEAEFSPRLVRDGDLKGIRISHDFIDIRIPEKYNFFCNLMKRN